MIYDVRTFYACAWFCIGLFQTVGPANHALKWLNGCRDGGKRGVHILAVACAVVGVGAGGDGDTATTGKRIVRIGFVMVVGNKVWVGADDLVIIVSIAEHKGGAAGAGREVGIIPPTVGPGTRLYCL
jgi:hypothetical protein